MKDDIADTLLKLSVEEPFDKISVTGLARACGISRQTFYYYFDDVLDVAQYALQRELGAATEKAIACTHHKDTLLAIIDCVTANKGIIRHMSSSKMQHELLRMTYAELERVLKYIPIHMSEEDAGRFDHRLFKKCLPFYTHGIAGMMYTELIEKDGDPYEFAERLDLILRASMSAFLEPHPPL